MAAFPFPSPAPAILQRLPFSSAYHSPVTRFLQPVPFSGPYFSSHYLSLAPTFQETRVFVLGFEDPRVPAYRVSTLVGEGKAKWPMRWGGNVMTERIKDTCPQYRWHAIGSGKLSTPRLRQPSLEDQNGCSRNSPHNASAVAWGT